MKKSVVIESFRKNFWDGVKEAKSLGLDGVQVFATMGDITPETMNNSKIKEVNSFMAGEGLVFSAVCGDLGADVFYWPEREQSRLKTERAKRIFDLALQLGTNIVTTHIGVVPSDKRTERYEIMQQSCSEFAEYANSVGGHFAVETGPEKAVTLKSFLDEIGGKGLAVNLDPANLVMIAGDNPVQAVYTLKDYIVHTHVKDGIMVKQIDPNIIYDSLMNEGIESIVYNDYFKEVPLGQGSVDFENYFKALKDIGYSGFLTIEREVGDTPSEDIRLAADFISKKL